MVLARNVTLVGHLLPMLLGLEFMCPWACVFLKATKAVKCLVAERCARHGGVHACMFGSGLAHRDRVTSGS